jgi:hypothetical protein
MPCKTDVVVAHTIGIDTGKNMLHMVGLDEKGAIVNIQLATHGRSIQTCHKRKFCDLTDSMLEYH